MESAASAQNLVEVDDEVYEVLSRTAEARGTNISEVVKYLVQAPVVPAARDEDDDPAE